MDAINKNHWRSLKKFVAVTLKKAESHHINEDDQITFRIVLGLMNATDNRQKECEYSLFEGEGMNETFSIAVNQIFEGYHAPPDDYSIAHTRFKEERPYVCGLALDFGGIIITNVATALILGIIVNLVLGRKKSA